MLMFDGGQSDSPISERSLLQWAHRSCTRNSIGREDEPKYAESLRSFAIVAFQDAPEFTPASNVAFGLRNEVFVEDGV